MGIRVEGGMPDPGDLEHVAKDRLFVKFNLS